MSGRIARIAAAAVLFPACLCEAQSWTDLGPAPVAAFAGATGRVSAIACGRTDPDRYYVGGADGGLWRSTDGGTTWTPLTGDAPTSAVGAVALDPTDENIIYVGTGEANFANHSRYGLGLLKSADGGASWTLLGGATFAGRCFSKIAVNPQNAQVLYAAITRAGGFPALAAAKGHPGATGARGVFRSPDGGATWARLTGLPDLCATDLTMDPANPLVLYAAIGYIFGDPANGLYKTTDGGDTWARLTNGLPTGTMGRISLAVAPSFAPRLYAFFTSPSDSTGGGATLLAARRSDDAGASWAPIAATVSQSTYGWYLSVAAVHPTQPDTVFFGGLDLGRSTNAGASWSTVSAPHPDNHALAFDAAGRLLVGCDGGVYRSSDLGASWISRNAGLGVIQFYAGLSTDPGAPDVVLGGAQDNGTNRRTGPSPVWTQVLGGDGGWTETDQTNPQRFFAEYQGTGGLFRTTDGGVSFSSAGLGLSGRNCFLPPYLIDPQNPSRMLYGTERVFVSTNGATTWTALSADLTGGGAAAIRALAIAPTNSLYVYAATNDGRVLASSDGGATFAPRLTGVQGWPRTTRELTVDPADPRTVYLAGATFGVPHVRRSRDAGVTWDTLDGNLPDVPVNVIGIDPRGGGGEPLLFAGTDAGLYRSVNSGQTWRRYGAGLATSAVIDIRIETQRNRMVIGTQGRGAWATPLAFCYPDVDDDGVLSVADFTKFLQLYAAGSPRANCDASTTTPPLNVADFTCFLQKYAVGCP